MDSNVLDMENGRTSGDGMEEETNVPKKEAKQLLASSSTPPIKSQQQQRRQMMHRKDSCTVQENLHVRCSNPVPNTSTCCNTVSATPTAAPVLPGLHALYRRPGILSRSLAPVKPKGELVPLTPRLIERSTTAQPNNHQRTKPPKFVPFEPYPGAVNPIIPRSNSELQRVGHKVNKNNLDIGVLVSQMSDMRTQELDAREENCHDVARNVSESAHLQLQDELKVVKEERDYLQKQFNFQTKVNSELKNLLVASVGEDLQTRVNILTEDKLQLARALLDTAYNLTTHTEQIEFLAGQCEVWRSKFLASSVMVEELARWKADLTQKNQMLTDSNRQLLQTMQQLREMQLEILKNLKFLSKIRYLNLPASDVVSLSAENLNIVQQMVLHTGVGMPENLNISSASRDTMCDAEKLAIQALEFVSQPLMATDAAISALFGQVQRPYARGDIADRCSNSELNIESTS